MFPGVARPNDRSVTAQLYGEIGSLAAWSPSSTHNRSYCTRWHAYSDQSLSGLTDNALDDLLRERVCQGLP